VACRLPCGSEWHRVGLGGRRAASSVDLPVPLDPIRPAIVRAQRKAADRAAPEGQDTLRSVARMRLMVKLPPRTGSRLPENLIFRKSTATW
jgi:hypothetical protein